jgi:hypothetical protein
MVTFDHSKWMVFCTKEKRFDWAKWLNYGVQFSLNVVAFLLTQQDFAARWRDVFFLSRSKLCITS